MYLSQVYLVLFLFADTAITLIMLTSALTKICIYLSPKIENSRCDVRIEELHHRQHRDSKRNMYYKSFLHLIKRQIVILNPSGIKLRPRLKFIYEILFISFLLRISTRIMLLTHVLVLNSGKMSFFWLSKRYRTSKAWVLYCRRTKI